MFLSAGFLLRFPTLALSLEFFSQHKLVSVMVEKQSFLMPPSAVRKMFDLRYRKVAVPFNWIQGGFSSCVYEHETLRYSISFNLLKAFLREKE